MISMFRPNNKKGVSPLIATVLLIAFAIALGTVIMNWGRGELYSSPVYDVCSYDNGDLEFTFNNPGNKDLNLEDLIVEGTNNRRYAPESLEAFSVKEQTTYKETISYSSEEYGSIQNVRFSLLKSGTEIGKCEG